MATMTIGKNSSVAQLRAVVTVPEPADYTLTFVVGVRNFYSWDAASTGADDGVSVVLPNDRDAATPGRWLVESGSADSFDSEVSYFGDGSDGDLTASSGTTTLTRDTSYDNVTLSGTAVIATAGFVLRVKGTLDLTAAQAGAIHRVGAPGSAGAADGTAGAAAATNMATGNTLGGALASIIGGAGGTGAGTQAGALGAQIGAVGGAGGASSAGGAGSGGAGGGLRNGGVITAYGGGLRSIHPGAPLAGLSFTGGTGTAIGMTGGATGGSGGGGGGDGTAGGGGGSGGVGGGIVFVFARALVTGASTPAGVVTVSGGAGGAGGTPAAGNRGGGGAGGGGGGGGLQLVVGSRSGSTVTGGLVASGGTGGTGGSGTGTGAGANGAVGGTGGAISYANLAAGTYARTGGAAGSAGSAAAGTVGGAGGAGGACVADL